MKPLFPVLKSNSGLGSGITQVTEGTEVAAVDSAISALTFKDAAGNLVYPELIQNKLRIADSGAGTVVRDHAEVLGTNSFQEIASFQLTDGTTYSDIVIQFSCRRETVCEIRYGSTIIADGFVGPGQYTIKFFIPGGGLTGDGNLISCYAKNLNRTASIRVDIRATMLGSVPVPSATQLDFQQNPTNTISDFTITPPITVRVEDSMGLLVTTSTASVSLAIQNNPSSGSLSGVATVNAVGGLATFSGLSINQAGNGYTLIATSAGLSNDISAAFDIAAKTFDDDVCDLYAIDT